VLADLAVGKTLGDETYDLMLRRREARPAARRPLPLTAGPAYVGDGVVK
jgi:hypothetical protein